MLRARGSNRNSTTAPAHGAGEGGGVQNTQAARIVLARIVSQRASELPPELAGALRGADQRPRPAPRAPGQNERPAPRAPERPGPGHNARVIRRQGPARARGPG